MPRRRYRPQSRDLFDAVVEPAVAQMGEQSSPVLLPSDLEVSLSALSAREFDRLHRAVAKEAVRRGTRDPAHAPAPVVATPERPAPTGRKSARAARLTRTQANLIRTAFQAGVGPAAIARQFGLPQALVRDVLKTDER